MVLQLRNMLDSNTALGVLQTESRKKLQGIAISATKKEEKVADYTKELGANNWNDK